jgi:hypothetical protein
MGGFSYKKLIDVTVDHDFYENGISKDLQFLPTIETQQLFASNKLKFRETNSGFETWFKSLNKIDPIFPFDDMRFTFGLQIGATINTSKAVFVNITDLDESPSKKYAAGKFPFFTNSSGSLVYELLDGLKAALFTYEFPFTGAVAGTLTVTDAEGVEVDVLFDTDGNPIAQPYPVTPTDDDAYLQQVDFRQLPPGKYILSTTGASSATEEFYIDTNLVGQDVFGVIEIDYASGTLPSIPEHTMQFIRRESFWKYFVINQSGNVDLDDFDLDIVDTSGDGATGDVYGTYTFTMGSGGSPDPSIAINGFETVVFISDQLIPFFEASKLGLELSCTDCTITGGLTTTLIKNLSNANRSGISTDESEIFVFI